jgi:predicted MFS family arabinose efflux permease
MSFPKAATPAGGNGDLGRGRMMLLVVLIFATSGSIHYQTPMLAAMGAEFGADAASVGWVATLTFGGFLVGTLFIVPLGDRLDKRDLLLVQFTVLIVALLATAAAPSLALLAAAGFVTGVCTASVQVVVPIVAELAPPAERGRALGTVLSALFLGILFGRVAGGFVASHLGWRWMYVFAALMLTALAPVLFLHLPSLPPKTRLGYGALMRSLIQLLRTHAELRRAAAIQFLLGISYGGFWATIAPMMLLLYHLGPTEAGLMGIPGAAGILVARPAGRWMDRHGVAPVVKTGVRLVLAAFVVFAFAGWWIGTVVGGAILLDCGLRSAMVANQTLISTLDPDARSRSNTVFSGSVWGGNAAGAFLASTALTRFGWLAVCAIAVTASVIALLVQNRPVRHG